MITITIDTGNDAFDNRGLEVARILRKVASYYEDNDEGDGLAIMDANGNKVGIVRDSPE